MSRALIKDSTIYGLGALLGNSLGFILIPLYTRYLDVSEYGTLALLNQILQLTSFVFLFGLSMAATRLYFDDGADQAYRGRLYGNATLLLIVLPPLLLLLLGPLIWLAATTWLPSVPFFPYVALILVTGLFTPVAKLAQGLLRVQRRAKAFVLYDLSFFVVQALIIIIAVAGLGYGLRGQVTGQLLANALFFFVAIAILATFCRPTVSAPLAWRMLRFGVPLIPFFVLTWLNPAAGRFLLERFTDLDQVGLFALASQFAGLLLLASTAFDNAFLPHFLERAGEAGAESELGLLVTRYVALFGLMSLGIVAFSAPAIYLVTSSAYHGAASFVAPLTLANWLFAVRRPLVWCFTHKRRSGALSVVQGLAVLVLIALLFLFLGPLDLGIMGVAYAAILSNVFFLTAGFRISQVGFRLAIPWSQLSRMTILIVASGALIVGLGSEQLLDPAVIAMQVVIIAATTVYVARQAGIRDIRALVRSAR